MDHASRSFSERRLYASSFLFTPVVDRAIVIPFHKVVRRREEHIGFAVQGGAPLADPDDRREMRPAESAVFRPAGGAARSLSARKSPVKGVMFHCTTLCLFLMMSAAFCRADEFPNALSLQGYTGLLNTPNAGLTDEGKFNALFSDQKENRWRDQAPREANYLFSVGFFSFAELGGRLTDAPGADRDLSGNIKVKVPFIPRGQGLPDVAIGVQDAGGGKAYLQTRYIVATESWQRLRLSLGYATGPDRMKGTFGGAEIKAMDWLYLVGENDARETNVGARIVAQAIFGFPVDLQVTAKTSLNYRTGNWEFGFGLQFPLGSDRHNRTPVPEEPGKARPSDAPVPAAPGPLREGAFPEAGEGSSPAGPGTAVKPAVRQGGNEGLLLLLEKLTADGFQNVRVGVRGEELLVVEFENSRYNLNELDGLGVVIGMIVDTVPRGGETLRLILKQQDIRVLELSAPLEAFRAFLHDPEKYRELNETLLITTDIEDDSGVTFLAVPGNPSFLTSALVVYPGLKTFVATEVGTFDYLLSARLDYFLNAWKGAVVNARWDIPVNWSENFDDGKAFENSRNNSRLDRLMLFQAIKVSPRVMASLGGGMVLHDSYGTLNEVMVTPGDGTHRFAFKQAYAASTDDRADPRRNEAFLGSYRYYFSPLDLALGGTVGRFFDNDKGYRLEVKRFFGDTSFSVYLANTRTSARERVQVGGVMIAFPLTPRRDMKPGVVQLKGSEEWSYAQEVQIVTPGVVNAVSTSIGVDPTARYNLERVFFNRDRLSEPYLRKHLLRLRDAYMTYLRGERR
jgi:hypothetical protein